MAIINLDIAPYYDDYDPTKDYLRVLFRPGYPVQARELTTLQTMLQEQIARFGNNIFKDGSRVTGASINVDTSSTGVTLVASGSVNFPISDRTEILATLDSLVGLTVTDETGTIKAKVLRLSTGTTGTAQLGNIYIKYISAATFEKPGFQNDPITEGYLFARRGDNPGLNADLFNVFNGISPCTLANIADGVYYISGEFIRVLEQLVVVSPTSRTPTAILGFAVTPTFVTASEDPTLFDNARNSSNEGAPGANRLKVNLSFSARAINSVADPLFYRVLTITNGVVQEYRSANPQYAELLNTLARRTYDESGNYALNPFTASIKDGPTEDQFTISLAPSKAYVKGYEIETLANTDVLSDRGLSSRRFGPGAGGTWAPGTPPITVSTPGPTFVPVTNITGVIPGFETGNTNPGDASNLLLLLDSESRPIGQAHGWGILNFNGTGTLYLYDVSMYQYVFFNLNGGNPLNIMGGNEVVDAEGNIGYAQQNVFNVNQVILTDTQAPLLPGAFTTSTFVKNLATIASSTTYVVDQVRTIRGGTFNATVAGEFGGSNQDLIYPFDAVMKTTLGADGLPVDNLFNILYSLPPDAANWRNESDSWTNGAWNNYINRQPVPQINKTLNFACVRIRNTSLDSDMYRTNVGANYGWDAQDPQISLYYTDIQNVYGVVKAANALDSDGNGNTFHTYPNLNRLSITGPEIPAGYIITGQTSGTRAIVAVSNNANRTTTSLINLDTWHNAVNGTGSTGQIDVLFLNGTAFTAGEQLVAIQQSDNTSATGYSLTATYNGVTYLQDPDITSLYMLDNGQRGEYYDTGRLVLKDDTPTPYGGDLLVFFSYFTATNLTGGFYNVDSYAGAGFFDNDVRYYQGPQDIVTLDPLNGQDLRNAIDFRQRVMVNWSFADNSLAVSRRTFARQSHVTPNEAIDFSGERYLSRVDTITLDKDGVFRRVPGIPDIIAQRRLDDPDVMTLNYISVPAAVRYAERQVGITTVDNRRYTMRDIGALHARLDRVENTVTLSLLESQALSDDIGDDRIKMGFLVDGFDTPDNDDGIINPGQIRDAFGPEHNASVDIINRVGRAGYAEFPITMSVDLANSTNIDPYYLNLNANGTLTDPTRSSYIVKSYNEVVLLSQTQASSAYRINPYATWVYTGQMNINPKQDFWRRQVPPDGMNASSVLSVKLPTRNVNGVNVVDPTFFSQYSGVVYDIPGAPFNRNEVNWTGRQQVSNNGPVDEVIGSGAASRTFQVTGTRTTISGTTFNNVSSLRQVARAFRSRTSNPAPRSSFMRSAAELDANPEKGINFYITQLRADTPLKAIFDGQDVTQYCRQFNSSGILGAYGALRSDNAGSISGNFAIPGGTFRIGTRTLLLTDLDNTFTTYAAAGFTSDGTFDEGVFYNFSADQPFVVGSAATMNETRRVRELYDPVAQTFTLPLAEGLSASNLDLTDQEQQPGAFITSVDLYFQFVDIEPQQNVVNIQIRSVVNGYPGPDVIGRGTITLTEAAASPDASIATNIRLSAPCFLETNKEYALVVLSPSPKTTVWTATQGENDIATGGLISRQPSVGGYYGSFFTSQNNSTWNADQNRDLTFRMHRARFTTNNTSVRLFNTDSNFYGNVGNDVPYQRSNALTTYNNCRYIKVSCPNHGMYLGRLDSPFIVSLDGVQANFFDTATNQNTFNGIPLNLLNGQSFPVRYPTLHSFFIELPLQESILNVRSGTGGGDTVIISQCRQYDALKSNLNATNFPTTNVSMSVTSVGGTTVSFAADASQLIVYNTDPDFGIAKAYNCTVDEYCEFEKPQLLFNTINDGLFDASYSLESTINLSNTDDTLSPVIRYDALRTFHAYRNNIANVMSSNEIASSLNPNALVTPIPSEVINATRQLQYLSYISAVQSLQEDAKYVTKQVDLFLPATGFNIMFEADMEPTSAIEFSYKIRPPGFNTPFNEIPWVDFTPDQFINEVNYGKFASAPIYNLYSARLRLASSFGSFQIRLRFRSDNEAQTPRVKNLRITAVA